jgi:hypothetical protein
MTALDKMRELKSVPMGYAPFLAELMQAIKERPAAGHQQ